MSNEIREKFLIGLKSHMKCMSKESCTKESFNRLLVSLIQDGLLFLMSEIEIDELENLCYDIEYYLDDLDNLSEEEFNIMMKK